MSLAFATVRGSKSLHHDLITTVVHAPMSFFDTTPIGRILNRFSQDMVWVLGAAWPTGAAHECHRSRRWIVFQGLVLFVVLAVPVGHRRQQLV